MGDVFQIAIVRREAITWAYEKVDGPIMLDYHGLCSRLLCKAGDPDSIIVQTAPLTIPVCHLVNLMIVLKLPAILAPKRNLKFNETCEKCSPLVLCDPCCASKAAAHFKHIKGESSAVEEFIKRT